MQIAFVIETRAARKLINYVGETFEGMWPLCFFTSQQMGESIWKGNKSLQHKLLKVLCFVPFFTLHIIMMFRYENLFNVLSYFIWNILVLDEIIFYMNFLAIYVDVHEMQLR